MQLTPEEQQRYDEQREQKRREYEAWRQQKIKEGKEKIAARKAAGLYFPSRKDRMF